MRVVGSVERQQWGWGVVKATFKSIELITLTDVSKKELTCYIFLNNKDNDVLLNHTDSRLSASP